MIGAFKKALLQLDDPAVRQTLWSSLLLSLTLFVLLLLVLSAILTNTTLLDIGWLETALDVLGGVAALILTWVLFPAVSLMIMPFFLERVAVAVERRHYPDLPQPREQPIVEAVIQSAKFVGVALVLNLLALPIYIFVPLINVFVFYAVNGYLLSREYFEMVAFRRLDEAASRRVRRAVQMPLLLFGAVIAFLLTLPVVNLVAPVVATATMVHLLENWRSRWAS